MCLLSVLVSIFCYIVDLPKSLCKVEVAAALLMWSGSEVTQAILGNMALKISRLNNFMYTFARVCAEQDRKENGSRHLRYKYCLYCTYKPLVAINFMIM